jgi:nucleotide-binding universal stress UspA family protein
MEYSGFGVVLCPVDFSPISAAALKRAAQLAACDGARLIAMYASSFDVPPYFTVARIEELASEFRAAQADAERALSTFVNETLGESVHGETRVVEGLPADAILKTAAETGAGAIVMGTHGRSGYSRWMLGSVAERVLRESPVPVLTSRGGETAPMRRILCAVDHSPVSREALKLAIRFASRAKGTLTVLHVSEGPERSSIGELRDWRAEGAAEDIEIHQLELHGNASEQIVRTASSGEFDLLVVGASRRKFFDGYLLGPATLRAVRHATCPVLTVHEPTGAGAGAPDVESSST